MVQGRNILRIGDGSEVLRFEQRGFISIAKFSLQLAVKQPALALDKSDSKRAAGENIVLSAFPRNMRLHDPSTPNLKIDLLAEISQSPRILLEVDAALKAKL
ncbi:CCR4-NOT transcription complex subunit 1 isoform X1 [Tanacetum coccineum]